jgi:bla regulator protein blaR1
MERVLFESAVRAILMAAGTALVLWLMRVRSPAAKHSAWTGLLILMLLLPAWTAWGPKTTWRILPAVSGDAAAQFTHAGKFVPASATHEIQGAPRTDPMPVWQTTAIALYLLGLSVLLLRLAVGTVRAQRLIRSATPSDGVLVSQLCAAPLTVGWLHPAVILPAGQREWSKGQLRAVLDHEQTHARRRDPLVQWLAMLNRAIFWFHPLAWWLERQLSALAEEACDAVVLERGHAPRDYSLYLIHIARSAASTVAQSNLWGMAMPGSFLASRIRTILEGGPAPLVSKRRFACACAACAVASCLSGAVSLGLAQASPQTSVNASTAAVRLPEFEVASIKPNRNGAGNVNGQGGSTHFAGAELTMENVSLWKCIGVAYGIGEDKDYALSGPAWLKSDRFDITAKVPAEILKDPANIRDQVQLMLQSLLTTRFKLSAHRESKIMSAYAMVVANGGLKVREVEPGGGVTIANGRLAGKTPLVHLADLVSQIVDRPVVDQTELKGVYDIKLAWAPEQSLSAPAEERRPAVDTSGPSIFTAFEEQLGLRLETHKLPVAVLVIDHAEKIPTDN